MTLACLDGELVEAAEARIPVTDEGLLRGDGVFEVMRLYAGRPFALDEHLERMAGSAAGLRLPLDLDVVRADITTLLAAAGQGVDGGLRVLVTRGGHRVVLIEALRVLDRPLRLGLVTFAPTRVLDAIKSLSYGANMLCTRLAKERGFDDALLVTPHGRVLEAPTSAFFYVLDDGAGLCTPPLSDHILPSITRAHLLALTGATERSLAADDLGSISEAFLASTLREVHPIDTIEERTIEAPGPLTAAAAAAMHEHVAAAVSAAQ